MFPVFLEVDIKNIAILAGIGLLLLTILSIIITKHKYKARYRRFYKKFDKVINKKYNGNMLIEDLINKYTVDNTNTYKSLKRKGKKITKKYFEYYLKYLPEQVLLKSFISPDMKRNELVIKILDEHERLLYQWDKTKKFKTFLKAINKHQMLTPMIAFLYELPLNINEGNPYRIVNHDNDNILTYDVVKNPKKVDKKINLKKNKKDKLNKKK